MLQAAQSQNVAQDQLTVYFNTNPRAYIAFQARLLRAYDPYGPIPPSAEALSKLCDIAVSQAAIADLNRELSSKGIAFGTSKDRFALIEQADAKISGASGTITELTAWFTMGGILVPPRGHLFTTTSAADLVRNTPVVEALESLCDIDSSEGWLTEDEVKHLALITLWGRYGQLASDNSFLTSSELAPPNAPKELWAQVQRVMKLVTLARVLIDSISLAPLREKAAFIMSPAIKPLLAYVSAEHRERTEALAGRLLALKVHPFIAEAERLRTVTRRYTEWGNASPTMGLAGGDDGAWSTLKNYATARDGGAASLVDVRGVITADKAEGGLVANFVDEARDIFMLRDMLDQGYIAQAEAALGLTQPGPAPDVHLWGEKWRALVQTGTMASESLSDWFTLLLRPRFPLLNAEGWSELAGNTDAFAYNARLWVTGDNSQVAMRSLIARPEQRVPIFPQPQHPEHISGYGLREITPEMVRPVTDGEYFGDEDAVFRPLTPEGVASILGFGSVAAMSSNSSVMNRLGHLLIKQSGQLVPAPATKGAVRVFHSTRTRQPWRVRVDVPESGMPTSTMAMDERTSPSEHDIEATIFRTPELPQMTATTLAVADGAAKAAARAVGAE